MIPYGRQDINQADIDAVTEILKSDFLTQGPTIVNFEKAVAEYCSAKYAVAVNSATSALHIACMALDLGPGDWLWTSPNTFVATSNGALYCNANVDFVDIDPNTYNISIEALKDKLESAKRNNRLPKVVAPVHFSGQSAEMEAIFKLSQEYGFKIIEDASHAIGASYKNQKVGICKYSDITVFSFHPVKIITTGEGGMLTTNDPLLFDRLQRHRSHGITSNPSQMSERPADEIWNYQQIMMGYNYRITDIQAALGLNQIKRLDEFVNIRHRIANRYNQELARLPIQLPFQHPDTYSSFHLYVIRIKLNESPKTQKEVYDALQLGGVNVNLHYIPVHRQPYYENLGFKAGYCPESELYHKETLSIPMYPTLTEEEQSKVIEILHNCFS
jgi:UDP-4-amino-4,6-dideoxy-N-acetyl-beta-L-altrosamine transaminase